MNHCGRCGKPQHGSTPCELAPRTWAGVAANVHHAGPKGATVPPTEAEALRARVAELEAELSRTEADLTVAVHEATRARAAIRKAVNDLGPRYTVAAENALRVVSLLHEDARRIAGELSAALAAAGPDGER